MKKNLSRLFACTIALSMLLTACGGSATTTKAAADATTAAGQTTAAGETTAAPTGEGGKISILTSQGSYRAEIVEKMSAKMKELYNYEIDWQVLPDDQYYVITKSKVATGEVPDIIEYNTPSNNIELNAHEKVVPLDDQPWVQRLVNPDLLKDPGDGKIYAQPRESGTFFGGVYYNAKVLKDLGVSTEQPKTMAELVDRMKQIKEKSGGAITPLYLSNGPAAAWTTQIFMTLGYAVHNYPNDKAVFQQLLENKLTFAEAPGFVEVLTQFKQFFSEGLVNEDNLSADYDACQQAIGTNKAAMTFQGEWFVSAVQEKYPETEFGSWVIPYNNNLIMGTGAYVRGYFVMKDGKQVDKALDFLNKWSQPEIQNIYYQIQPGFSAFKDVDGGKVDESVQSLVTNYLETGKYTYQINDPMGVISSIWPELWKLYADMIASDLDPKEVLESWQVIYADYMKQQEQPGF